MSDELCSDNTHYDSCGLLPLDHANARPRQFRAGAVTRLPESGGQAVDEDRNYRLRRMTGAGSPSRTLHDARSIAATGSTQGGLAGWQLRQVELHLDNNLAKTIRIRDLAAIVRLSSSYFFQAFRCTTGKSPHSYILRRRIVHAQELMLSTDLSLSQIALDCGLADQPHLTRLFCRIVGMSPAKWRRVNCVAK